MRLASRWSLASLALVATIAVGPASAQDDGEGEPEFKEFSETGFYLTALGTVSFQIANQEDYAEVFLDGAQERADVDPALGLDARAGYRLMDELAAEANFTWLTDREWESTRIDSAGQSLTPDNESKARSWALTGQLKYFFATDQVQPYVLAGAGWSEIRSRLQGGSPTQLMGDRSVTEDGFVGKFAGGIDWYLNRRIATTFEIGYLLPTGRISETDQLFLTFGLTLRFYGSQ